MTALWEALYNAALRRLPSLEEAYKQRDIPLIYPALSLKVGYTCRVFL